MDFIYICGLPGTGKGVLRVLLDSSDPKIINCPFQGFGFELLSKNLNSFLVRNKTIAVSNRHKYLTKGAIYVDKKILSIGEFFYILSPSLKNLIDSSHWSFIRTGASEHKEQYVNFKFDYHKFHKILSEPFNQKKHFRNNLDLYYFFIKSFIFVWKKIDTNKKKTIFLTSAPNGHIPVNDIFESFKEAKNFKILSMKRNTEGYFLTNYIRFSDKQSQKSLVFMLRMIISRNLWGKYFKYLNITKDKKSITVIDFDDLIMRTEKVMKNLASNLNICYSSKMLNPSLDSILLENNFTSNIIDDPKKNFNSFTRILLKLYLLLYEK